MSRLLFKCSPQFVRPLDERDIERIFEIRFANDSGQSMRRAEIVRRMKLIQAEHTKAALGEMKRRGTAHCAQANDDDFVVEGHAAALTIAFEKVFCQTSKRFSALAQ